MLDCRIYVYGSRDELGNTWCSNSYNVLFSSDMTHLDLEQNSFETEGLGKLTDYASNILYGPLLFKLYPDIQKSV